MQHRTWRWIGVGGLALAAVGCTPSWQDREATMDRSLRERIKAEQLSVLNSQNEGDATRTVEVTRDPSDVESRLSDDRLVELDEMSGSAAYADTTVQPGSDLTGSQALQRVELPLDEAVRLAVEHNLDLGVARLTTRIAEQQRIQAEAAFDAVLFADADWAKLDTPQPPGAIAGLAGDQQSENFTLNTGIRKLIADSGATVQLDTSISYIEQEPTIFAVDSYYDADVAARINQPLLRGFGSDVNRAQIELARNAEQSSFQQVRTTINELINQVESAYWSLDLQWRTLLIQQRLLDRTIAERDRLVQRQDFDVSPVRITEANSFVELRRADVIRARAAVRDASDQLKRLINDPDLPLAGETLLYPTDAPADTSISFSLVDAITTALQQRPELAARLLDINDAGIRQRVADNGRLARLDLTAALIVNGIDTDEWADAYSNAGELEYIDYVLGLSFEQPLGNRPAEALARQRRLERDQAVVAYRRDAQDIVLELKTALRAVLTNYELVGATRAARRAAADSLRAINVREQVGVALTDEFLLDLKLNTQQRLADAERQEAQALANYMTAIAELNRAQGTILEKHGIDTQNAAD